MATTLYTIGYEKRTIVAYIDILAKNGIGIVIDVRDRAWSHKRDFRKENLKPHIEQAGLRYIHVKEAGNPSSIRKSAKSLPELLSRYREHLRTTRSGLKELSAILRMAEEEGIAVVLTCFELDHRACHRSILASYLKRIHRGLSVVHL